MGALPPVFIEFLGSATGFHATSKGVRSELAAVEKQGGGNIAKLGAVSKAALLGIGVAAGVAAVKTVHMAADFQTQMTRIRTSAGEAAGNMNMVSRGVLQLAGEVGESTKDLTAGLYYIESAGFHGAAGLDVLKASAEGAKVGNADMATVADAVTTALNSYGLGAGNVTQVMNALIATEAEGKAQMEDLASAMSGILPVSAAAHIGLYEVLGAMATMTAQGTNARVAATYLRQTIGQLSNPTAKARDEMKSLGLNSVEVSKNLGKNGLISTLNMLTDAIESHMGPAGTVLIDKLKAASGNTTEFQKILANLPPTQQTYIGALATMVGGTKSMMGALQLTGPHMDKFRENTKGIAEHVKHGGKEIEGWSDVQKTFNQRVAEAKGSLQAISIEIGTALLPAALKLIDAFSATVRWFIAHKSASIALATAIGVILVIGLAAATVAVWSFTAALLANPLTWVIVGIVALVAAIVLLIMNWQAVADWIKGAWNAAIGKVVDGWHWLADETKSIWNDDIIGPLKSAWNATADYFVGAWHTVVDPIVRAWDATWSVTVRVWNAISGFFHKWWPLLLVIFFPFIALTIAAWNHFHQAVWDFAVSVWNKIYGFLGAVWAEIANTAQTGWGLIKSYVIQPMKDAYNAVAGVARRIGSYLSARWDSIAAGTSSRWGRVKNAILGPIESAAKSIGGTVSKITNAVSNGISSALKKLKTIGNDWVSVGRDIVNGIIRGVGDAGGLLVDKMKSLANDALSGAKSFLGINSPSRRAADEIGHWIPHGIAMGVTRAAAVVGRAINAVTGGALTRPTIGPADLAMGTSGGAVVHNHYTVHVEGSVIAERDLAGTVQRVMGQLGARNPQSYPNYRR